MQRRFFNSHLAVIAAIAARNDAQMAAPADKPIKLWGLPESETEQLRTQINNLTASFRLLTAKLDLDAGVTDTNYGALITDSAIATAPVKLTVL